MVEYWNSDGGTVWWNSGTVMEEQFWWNSDGGTVWLNSGTVLWNSVTVMVEQCWWNSETVIAEQCGGTLEQ